MHIGRFFAGALILLGFVAAASQVIAQDTTPIATSTPRDPIEVKIGIKIDQIVGVDQRSENYEAVVILSAEWQDPALAFDPSEEGDAIKVFDRDGMGGYAKDAQTILPIFVIGNQQSNRWIHQAAAAVDSDGYATYVEKSSLTLQAPDFDFRRYPFDRQVFHFEVLSVLPTNFVRYVTWPEQSGLGDALGEEEWILRGDMIGATTVHGLTGAETDQVTLTFYGHRHITYYVIRVFVPMLVLITVGWALFFLDEIRRRIEIAGGNLLVFVAFNWAISADLPKLGYLTFLDFILQCMFVVTGAIIVCNVMLRRLKVQGREALAKRLDNYIIKWIYPMGYAAIVGFAVLFYLIKPVEWFLS